MPALQRGANHVSSTSVGARTRDTHLLKLPFGKTGDCVCRSMAIITKMPYAYVVMLLNEHAQQQRIMKRQPKRGSARTGI